jgi:hypothetical protein
MEFGGAITVSDQIPGISATYWAFPAKAAVCRRGPHFGLCFGSLQNHFVLFRKLWLEYLHCVRRVRLRTPMVEMERRVSAAKMAKYGGATSPPSIQLAF